MIATREPLIGLACSFSARPIFSTQKYGMRWLTSPAVQDAVLSHCETRKDRFAILDSPETLEKNAGIDKLPRFLVYNPFNAWGRQREVPKAPALTFRQWYLKNRGRPE